MPKRQIIEIDLEKCDGCGKCVPSCEEGALQIVDGKARLVRDVYCDGLGACLGHCPQGAISIVERQADPFDQQAVAAHLAAARPMLPVLSASSRGGGCPGSAVQSLRPAPLRPQPGMPQLANIDAGGPERPSGLTNWPIQLHLVPPQAAFLQDADVLLVADCVPVAYADFHRRFLDGRPVLVGCPKLDDGRAYVQKLAQIIQFSGIRSLTVLHMQVPCCTGLVQIAQAAANLAGGGTPVQEVTISLQGQVLSETVTGCPSACPS